MKNGFTLIEVLCLLFLTIMMSMFAATSFQRIFEYTKTKIALTEIQHLLQRAKNEAEYRRLPTAICKARNGICNERGQELLLFINEQADGIIHHKKEMLAKYTMNVGAKLYWRTYPVYRNYIVFFPGRFLQQDNGTMWYCNKDKVGWGIIISRSGLLSTVFPDSAGSLNDSKNKRLQCHA